MNNKLRPKDHAEAVALFRAQVLGSVINRDLERGELLALLRETSQVRFRPPGSEIPPALWTPQSREWGVRPPTRCST